jgi:flagellar hook-length control protein FliK
MGESQNARGAGSDFLQSRFLEDSLARELRGNLSTDIVKNATLIMRNGDEGTIRLALRPASLGYVKIHLEMTENKIMGRIIVESNEALRAFQKELPVLEKAFKDSGFMEASLDMSLAQDTAQNAYGGGEYGQQQDGDFSPLDPALAAAIAASRYDYALERAGDADELLGTAEAVMPLSPKRKTVNLFI